jgi:hypothetical protein
MQPHPGDVRAPMVRVEEAPLTATDTAAAPPAPAQPVRDLSAELRAQAGDVSSCIPVAEVAGRAQLTVELDATVIESGAISRLAVRGAGLSPEAIACIRARLERARLPGSIPDAPRSVQARIVLDRQPVPAAASAGDSPATESGDQPAQPLVIQQRVR